MNQHSTTDIGYLGRYGLPVALFLFLGSLLYAVLNGKSDMAVFCGIFSVVIFVAYYLYRQADAADYHVLRKLRDCPQLTEPELVRMLLGTTTPGEVHASLLRLNERGIIRTRQCEPGAPLTYVVNEAPYFIGAPE
jgi:hypothetical protein